MSLAELIPSVRSLSRAEKIELKRMLDSELSAQEMLRSDAIPGAVEDDLLRQLAVAAQVDIPRPGESYEAAAVLMQFLENEKAKSR